jgi:outer membrane protein OmpA-like peptidoglycan-associated protein
MIGRAALAVIVLGSALAATPGPARARDLDYERLSQSLERLADDPRLGTLAPLQMDRARAALQALKDGGRKDRPQLIYIAERRIDIARTTAEAEAAESELADLQRENDRLQLQAARRDAEQARRELEQQRLQAQIRAEEAERMAQEAETARAEGEQASQAAEAARAEAAQAKRMADAQAKAAALAKKEAELAAAVSASAEVPTHRTMSLDAAAFVPGKGTLAKSGNEQIPRVVDFVNAMPASRVRIRSEVAGNHALAEARAKAVRDALIAAGISASRIETSASAAKGAATRVDIDLGAAK